MSTPSSRLLSLLSLLQTRRDWPGDVLADRLGVSPRTVRRDVDRLRDLGYPVHAAKGPDGGYRLEPGTHMPPLLLDDEQAVALVVALQTASTGVDGVDEAAVRALATLRQVMPARLRSAAEALQVTAVTRAPARERPSVDAETLMVVGGAVRAREVLRFDYAGGTANALGIPRRAEAHHLVTWGGRWYLVGYDLERDDWRTFRVDRMTPKTPSGPRYAPRDLPEADVATFVAERFRSISPWESSIRGEALIDRPADEIVRWAGRDGLVEALPDGRSRVVLSSWSWDGLAAQMAMFGAPLQVVGPTELVDAMRRLADRVTAAVA